MGITFYFAYLQNMEFVSELKPVRLVRRYKRFLADIEFESGEIATAHCPNPGRMTGLAEPGMRIWVQDVTSPSRKLKYSWKLSETHDGVLVGVDTNAANKIIGDALMAGKLPDFQDCENVESEVTVIKGSRFDFRLQNKGVPHVIEVKSVTLSRNHGVAEFPDAPSVRALKHVNALIELSKRGEKTAMIYLVQRDDCNWLRFASDIDPAYAKAIKIAEMNDVQLLAYSCLVTPERIDIRGPIPSIEV